MSDHKLSKRTKWDREDISRYNFKSRSTRIWGALIPEWNTKVKRTGLCFKIGDIYSSLETLSNSEHEVRFLDTKLSSRIEVCISFTNYDLAWEWFIAPCDLESNGRVPFIESLI